MCCAICPGIYQSETLPSISFPAGDVPPGRTYQVRVQKSIEFITDNNPARRAGSSRSSPAKGIWPAWSRAGEEICHVAVTMIGALQHYKVTDPSFHNCSVWRWPARQQISDFACNELQPVLLRT
jgi:hypothetical protein